MQRKLVAILAADMVGYSRLMGVDEEGTIARQHIYRETVLDPGIEANDGRIVKTTGDGLLVEFSSAVSALKFAVTAQEKIASAEQDSHPDKKIRYRIGVNVGDIVVDGDDILGDGVNVAARLESISEPGGICISDFVYQSIKGKLNLNFADQGPQNLKNIDEPVKVWKWVSDKVAEDKKAPISLEETKPSIAVLPFDNMSGDVEQEYFADGIAEDLITELSRMPWFYVLARNTSFTYKGRAVNIKTVGQELGVSYILEGSVRKSGARIRVTAQLIDTATGNHVWADRFDRELLDIFDIQDEITRAIVGAISPEFMSAEVKKSRHKDPSQLNAWECVMRGRAHVWKFGRQDNEVARILFERAIDVSPGGVMGLADLSLVHFLDAFYSWSPSQDVSMTLMLQTAEKAVNADENDPLALTILAWAQMFSLKWDKAIETIDRALEISPNFASAIGIRGSILATSGEPDIAILVINDALARSPRDAFLPFWLMCLFWAYHSLQDYEAGLECAKQSVRIAPDNPTFIRQLAVAHWMLGNKEQCADAVATYLEILPNALADDVRNIPAHNHETIERYVEIMKEMGVPTKSEE